MRRTEEEWWKDTWAICSVQSRWIIEESSPYWKWGKKNQYSTTYQSSSLFGKLLWSQITHWPKRKTGNVWCDTHCRSRWIFWENCVLHDFASKKQCSNLWGSIQVSRYRFLQCLAIIYAYTFFFFFCLQICRWNSWSVGSGEGGSWTRVLLVAVHTRKS